MTCVREAKESALQALSVLSPYSTTEAKQDVAEMTLKHLLLHIDAEELYRVALGMYDLPLAYMVISNAQARREIELNPILGDLSVAFPSNNRR